MIQETDQAIIDLVYRGGQISVRVLEKMIREYAQRSARNANTLKHGEQDLESLNKHGKKLEEVVIVDEGIIDVKRRLKAYSVDFSIMRDPDTNENHVFFKAQDYERVKSGLTQVAEDLMKQQRPIQEQQPSQERQSSQERQPPKQPMAERIKDAEIEAELRQAKRHETPSLDRDQNRTHDAR